MKLISALAISATLAGTTLAWRNTTDYFSDGRVQVVHHDPYYVATTTTVQPLKRDEDLPVSVLVQQQQQPLPVCYTNKCLRAMIAAPDDAASFCEAYLADVFTAASDLAPFQRSCCSPSKASSACACFGQATEAPSSAPTTTQGGASAEATHADPAATTSLPVLVGSSSLPVIIGSSSLPVVIGSSSVPVLPASSSLPPIDLPAATSSVPQASPTITTSAVPTDTTSSLPVPTSTTCAASGGACNIYNFVDVCCPSANGVISCDFTASGGNTMDGVCV